MPIKNLYFKLCSHFETSMNVWGSDHIKLFSHRLDCLFAHRLSSGWGGCGCVSWRGWNRGRSAGCGVNIAHLEVHALLQLLIFTPFSELGLITLLKELRKMVLLDGDDPLELVFWRRSSIYHVLQVHTVPIYANHVVPLRLRQNLFILITGEDNIHMYAYLFTKMTSAIWSATFFDYSNYKYQENILLMSSQ